MTPPPASPQPRHRRQTGLGTFLFGCPYYPEHWRPEDRQDDPASMAAAGVNCVRMGEFAWDLMEKRQGQYDFSFFDEQIERLAKYGVQTMMCTPTATPPRWLSQRHPELLRIDRDGRRMEHGTRQHCCTSSPLFGQFSREITAAMAGHFTANQHVIGWQTDNELNCHFALCFCPACQEGFKDWCRGRYHNDIAQLNAAWGNAFWALSYLDFDQLVLPYGRPARPNPSHVLDYYRFVSDSVCQFQREQVQILRQANSRWWITHNGLMGYIDYAAFTKDLDFLGVDIYPGFRPLDDHNPALGADRARSYGGNFIVPEMQSGPGGQVEYILPTPRPGQMRLWAYQAIAHGADGVLHFRWRTCRFGAEEYWCGVLDHDNKPRRRYEEFAQEGLELRHIGPDILGTSVDMEAAVMIEYDNEQAHAAMPLGMPSPAEQARVAHKELWRCKFPAGLIEASDSLAGLKLLVVPSFTMMDEALVARLGEFVRAGGVLVLTAWSGTRDRCNRITPLTPPGLLERLAGASVEEYGKLSEQENSLLLPDGSAADAHMWYEQLAPTTATPAARWERLHYAGSAGMTLNSVGSGKVFYIGTYLSDANVGALLGPALVEAALEPLVPGLPAPIEVTRRGGQGRQLLFLLNHSRDRHILEHVPPGHDLISGKNIMGRLELGPKELAIVKLK